MSIAGIICRYWSVGAADEGRALYVGGGDGEVELDKPLFKERQVLRFKPRTLAASAVGLPIWAVEINKSCWEPSGIERDGRSVRLFSGRSEEIEGTLVACDGTHLLLDVNEGRGLTYLLIEARLISGGFVGDKVFDPHDFIKPLEVVR